KEIQDTANDLRKRLDKFQGAFKGLTKDQVTQGLRVAMTFQQENAKAKGINREKVRNTPDRGLSRRSDMRVKELG
ncbi:hypothetical protein C7A11_31160, partial [Pseudomonas simiae]